MSEQGTHTFAEIMSQPTIWAEGLEIFAKQAASIMDFWERGAFDQMIFTGCGSTYYLSLTGAALFQALTGTSARAYPASELVFYPEAIYPRDKKTLLVTVSRSGETTETLEAAQLFRQAGKGQILAISCYSDSRLIATADTALVADSAREQSVAQTRSFGTMLVLAQLLAAQVAGQSDLQALHTLPERCAALLQTYHPLAQRLGEDHHIQRFFFLGSHTLYGIACEAMLKMKEMSLAYSEAFHTLEFRHGPMSMVNENTLIIGLLSEATHAHELEVLHEMHKRGARVLALADQARWLAGADWAEQVILDSGLPAGARPALYLPVLQLLAYYRALTNNQNPDRPTNLDAVVSLKPLRA